MFKSILSAPFKVLAEVASVANTLTEKAIGVDLDVLDIEGILQEIAEDIEQN